MTYGETFNYYYVFENTTNNTIKNVKIADTFPESLVWASGKNITVENAQGQDVTSDWTITKGTYNGTSRITLLMSKKTPLLANSGKFKVTVPVTVPSNAKSDTQMKNVVYICAEGVNAPKGPNGENIDCTTPPPPPPTECTPENNPHKDPACIIVKNQADLVIKKYVKTIDTTGDSQSAPINVTPGETFNYYYQFYNTGSVAIKNVVIKDTLPEYLSHTGNILVKDATGKDVTSDWTITRSTKKFDDGKDHIYLIMKKKTDLPAKSGVYTVTVPVTISSTVPKNLSLQNMAYICGDNTVGTPTGPNGENVCGNDNPPPPPPPGQCTPENNPYKDPACIVVPPDTPTGSTQYKAYYCATSDLVSSTADFSSLAACNDHRTYLKTKGWNDNQIGQCDPTTDFTSDRIAHEKATLLPLCTGVNPIC